MGLNPPIHNTYPSYNNLIVAPPGTTHRGVWKIGGGDVPVKFRVKKANDTFNTKTAHPIFHLSW